MSNHEPVEACRLADAALKLEREMALPQGQPGLPDVAAVSHVLDHAAFTVAAISNQAQLAAEFVRREHELHLVEAAFAHPDADVTHQVGLAFLGVRSAVAALDAARVALAATAKETEKIASIGGDQPHPTGQDARITKARLVNIVQAVALGQHDLAGELMERMSVEEAAELAALTATLHAQASARPAADPA